MSKKLHIPKVALLATVIMVVINLIPFRHGPTVTCFAGSGTQQKRIALLGVPFTYLRTSTRTGSDCYIKDKLRDPAITYDGQIYNNYHFNIVNFILNGFVALIVIGSINYFYRIKNGGKK